MKICKRFCASIIQAGRRVDMQMLIHVFNRDSLIFFGLCSIFIFVLDVMDNKLSRVGSKRGAVCGRGTSAANITRDVSFSSCPHCYDSARCLLKQQVSTACLHDIHPPIEKCANSDFCTAVPVSIEGGYRWCVPVLACFLLCGKYCKRKKRENKHYRKICRERARSIFRPQTQEGYGEHMLFLLRRAAEGSRRKNGEEEARRQIEKRRDVRAGKCVSLPPNAFQLHTVGDVR